MTINQVKGSSRRILALAWQEHAKKAKKRYGLPDELVEGVIEDLFQVDLGEHTEAYGNDMIDVAGRIFVDAKEMGLRKPLAIMAARQEVKDFHAIDKVPA